VHTSRHIRKNSGFSTQEEHVVLLGLEALTETPNLRYATRSNYILYVLHTGIQWEQLKTNRKELHYTNVYKWHNRWSKAGSYQALFEASVMHLHHTDQLDTSVLHGDGSNTVVKKGAKALATPAINTRKATKSSPS
jgi:transposase